MHTLRLLLFMLCMCSTAWAKPKLEAVSKVDLERYMGTWYVIASFPEDEQKNCYGMQAIYTLDDEDEFDLVDKCWIGGFDGELKTLEGSVDREGDGKDGRFESTFYVFFDYDYWVIDLDPGYQWTVVSEPTRKHLWIMARTPKMDPKVYVGIIERLKANHFAVGKLELMPQR
ncbi:MAG: lipocalin family protein [Bradymonadia bacterium]